MLREGGGFIVGQVKVHTRLVVIRMGALKPRLDYGGSGVRRLSYVLLDLKDVMECRKS
jgi:hypothetical protein